jgi:hypothetical protein
MWNMPMLLNLLTTRAETPEIAASRTINLESLEARTLFSAAGFIPAELLEAGAVANEPLATQMERLAPAANNQAATEDIDVQPEVDPTEGETLAGDLDGDNVVDANDINMLAKAVRLDITNEEFDLDGDGSVGRSDQDFLVRDILGTEYGDANLDGRVDGEDFKQLQDSLFTTNHGWQNGDFNGDFRIDGIDFIWWNQFKELETPLSQTTDAASDDASPSDQVPNETTELGTDMTLEEDMAAGATPRIDIQDSFAAKTKAKALAKTSALMVAAAAPLSGTSQGDASHSFDSKLDEPTWRSDVLKASHEGLQGRFFAELNKASTRAEVKEANYDLLKSLEEFVM